MVSGAEGGQRLEPLNLKLKEKVRVGGTVTSRGGELGNSSHVPHWRLLENR